MVKPAEDWVWTNHSGLMSRTGKGNTWQSTETALNVPLKNPERSQQRRRKSHEGNHPVQNHRVRRLGGQCS
jgi:hypothetical protein